MNVWKQEGYYYFYFVSLERMDRSPIENNPRPTLRGTSTCFRGSPGGFNRPTTYPPLPFVLFFGTLILFASCGKDFTGLQRYIGLIGNLAPSSQAFLFVCLIGLQRLEQGLRHGFGQSFGLRIYLPFWYVGCQMRVEPVFLIFGKPRGIL